MKYSSWCSIVIGLSLSVVKVNGHYCYEAAEAYICLPAGTHVNEVAHYCPGSGESGGTTCYSYWSTESDAVCTTSPQGLRGYYDKIGADCTTENVYITVVTCDANCNFSISYHQGPVTVICSGTWPDTSKPGCEIVKAPVRLPSYYCLAFL